MKARDYLVLFVKGFFLGIANIIPGVSGGTIAISLGIYEHLIEVINNFFSNVKKNMLFLLPIGFGIISSIILFGKIISYSLENYALVTVLFFIGLILGGMPLLYKEIKDKENLSNGIIMICSYLIIIIVSFCFSSDTTTQLVNISIIDYICLFLVGVVGCATMVIPGVSGSMILILLGYYELIINTVSNLTNFDEFGYNLSILIPFGLGMVVGIWLVAKLITFLFEKYKTKTYFAIIGFVVASIVIMISANDNMVYDVSNIIFGIILFIVGFIGSYKLSKLEV